MSALKAIGKAIFVGERTWAWRRRMALSGGAMSLAGCATAIWFDHDIAHASLVFTNSVALFGVSVGAFTTAAVVDDHLKRTAELGHRPQEGIHP